MVAAPGIRGIKVSIWSEDKELPEYNDSSLENTSRLAQRYVLCEAGKQFEVRIDYGLDAQFNSEGIVVDFQADGLHCERALFRKTSPRPDMWRNQGRQRSSAYFEPYQFAQLDKVATCPRKIDTERVKALGCIELEIGHCSVIGEPKEQHWTEAVDSPIGAITEQMLKGKTLSNSVAFGALIKESTDTAYYQIKRIGHPYIVQLFYRSKEDLKDMHVIPRTPSPEPLYKRDIDTLNKAELRSLQEEVRLLREQGIVVKREGERPAKRAKLTKVTLTLDDDGEFQEEEVALPSSGFPYALD